MNFNGFELRYEEDFVTELKLYTYFGGSQDYVGGNGESVYSCAINDSSESAAESGVPYKTLRSAEEPSLGICGYLLTIYSPSGSRFAYTIMTDAGLAPVFTLATALLGGFLLNF